jgi:hypothetical protein
MSDRLSLAANCDYRVLPAARLDSAIHSERALKTRSQQWCAGGGMTRPSLHRKG